MSGTQMLRVGAAVHLAAVSTLVLIGLTGDGHAVDDVLATVSRAALYAVPGVLAWTASEADRAPALAAGMASLVLAIVPFSGHSFVLGPLALLYLGVAVSGPLPATGRATAQAVAVAALLLGALFTTLIARHPVCVQIHADGTVVREPSPSGNSGSQVVDLAAGERGGACTSDTVVWWEATLALGLSAAALATGQSAAGWNRASSPV